jgi:bacteriocin biosynthesis cyclodehydratase domain-containing protein
MQKTKAANRQSEMRVPRYLGLSRVTRAKSGRVSLEFGYSGRLARSVEVDQQGLAAVRAFLKPRSPGSVASELGIPGKKMRQFCAALESQGILQADKPAPEEFERYDRHLLFYGLAGAEALRVQKRLSGSTIALIGMGGIGNWVSLGLIGAGLKSLKLIDFDQIELSNLTRQILFSEDDVGKHKVTVAAERLKIKNRSTRIQPVLDKIEGAKSLEKHLKGVDFVILSADRPAAIHDWVDEVCQKRGIPYINLGYCDGEGVIGPLTVPGKTSCYQCFKPKAQVHPREEWKGELHRAFESRYQAPSFGPLNGLVSSLGVVEVLKHLGGFGQSDSLDTELRVDPLALDIRRIAYKRDKKCWHCGNPSPKK